MARVLTRVTGFIVVFFFLLVGSMVGFIILKTSEGGSPTVIEAFAWTMITLSTLGYYSPAITLSSPTGQLFTSIIVIMGISVVFIGTPLMLVPWIERKVSHALKRRFVPVPIPVRNHVIICGYSPLVEETMDVLKLHGIPFVILNTNEDNIHIFEEREIPYVAGDPTDENILKAAFIDDALALIAAMDDESNAFICLTAKSIREDLQVVSSADNVESVKAIFAAKANKIVVPKLFAGNLLGQRACHDYSMHIPGKFAKLGDLEVRQYTIEPETPLKDRSLANSMIQLRSGAIIAGLWKEGELVLTPEPDQILTEGTTIIALGTDQQLDALYQMVRGEKAG